MKNLEKLFGMLQAEHLDGVLLTSQTNRLYFAEYDVAEGVALVTRKGSRYFTDSRYIEAAQNHLDGFEILMVDRSASYDQRINEAMKEFGLSTLGYEEEYLTVSEFRHYEEALQAKLVPCQKPLNRFRVVKEDWELQKMKRAQEITDKTFSELIEFIQPGMTEKRLAAELIYRLYRNGAEGLSFPPIVVSGPNTSLPHGVPGDRILKNGDFVTMDFGCTYQGYCSDMTRTVAISTVTEEMREVYNTVLHAQKCAIAATKAGMTGSEIDAIARNVIAEAGYGDCFGHGYGHSLGIEIHESPNCNPSGKEPIPVGAVISAEPGIYLPGKFGVRIEDVVVFTEDGCVDLTGSPKELMIL